MKSKASPDTSFYRGRFAPSPNGPLHFGSLIAATASFLDALVHNGEWWLRIDDIDPPRVVPGATDSILDTLGTYGFAWEGVVYQSQRHDLYAAHFDALQRSGYIYPCTCSRKMVFARHPRGLYSGHCRLNPPQAFDKPPAWRLQGVREQDAFDDLIQGHQTCDCPGEVGEFVIKRADGIWGYHFVCAVDEADMGITHVIRGADLLRSSFAQRQVLFALERPSPHYGHHPVITTPEGIKFSKRARSRALPLKAPSPVLACVFRHLGLDVPKELENETVSTLWEWGKAHYNRQLIPQQQAIPAHDCAPR
ncbi:glutamyl-Q tRNA(Asp) synthetase [Sulfurivirga caldicuralii]|uniref:Glutamyl-Q tRNA(Asp) synthetase n=1 Tax=Sulfurivirga caldicuralii TaxID=364032 RepID=A0A1N6FEV9_9GAMM|nr:tRNA glutamyl-Q(34) synthetase GluQRS [Sulfurivirga caldicuralii]SIN93843.1 glutamyl-Q tRNA(Asp) synthetase [Sulfurivirga caldicuralii]